MNQAEVAAFVSNLECAANRNFGYTFFFIGDDQQNFICILNPADENVATTQSVSNAKPRLSL